MKGSIIIVSFFILGVIMGRFGVFDINTLDIDISFISLALLMLFVGISVGNDLGSLKGLKELSPKLLLLPFVTIIGSLAGCFILSLFMSSRTIPDVLAIGSGFGYYSLSSIFITEYKGAELGTIALIANIAREIITLLGAPLLAWLAGPLAPITSGGATTMDTTLPVITKTSGSNFVILSIYHGFVVDFSVPFLVTFLCNI